MTKQQPVIPVAGSPKTISQRYEIGDSTVRRAIREGKLKASHCGRRIVIRFEDAERWIGRAK
jgi:excisionase family DNA binding protein